MPANPLIPEPLYLSRYIERMGTGIRDMIKRCRDVGLPEPEIRVDADVWVTTIRRPVPKVKNKGRRHQTAPPLTSGRKAPVGVPVALSATEILIIKALRTAALGRGALLEHPGYSQRTGHFRNAIRYQLDNRLIVLTIPDKPQSRLQMYRLASKGKKWLAIHTAGDF
ncbi:MAG: Fic family protein [Planctomycetota bacterium]